MSVRILIVDDHVILRQGLRALLDREHDFDVVGEAGDGREALRLTRKLRPDVVIMDINMPDLNGIDASHRIKAQNKEIYIVALSMHADARSVNSILAAGATAFVHKSTAVEDVNRAIRAVRKGRTFTSPQVSDLVLGNYVKLLNSQAKTGASPLTTREREVVQLVAEGRTNKAIAAELCLSINTIDTHRKRIMHKLGLHSVAGLTRFAIREGITAP